MQQAREPQWIYLPNGDVAGVALGSDSCSEHEWGVDRMKWLFGCSTEKDGIERRQITKIPKDLHRYNGISKHPYDKKTKDWPYEAIFLSPTESCYQQPKDIAEKKLCRYDDSTGLCTGWDEGTFGIVAYGEKDKKNLVALWDAFQKKDIAFYTNIGVFHSGGGLIFAIVSKIPDEDKKKMYDGDLKYKELLKQSAATGIEEELKVAKKEWIALSPRWAGKGDKTKYPVVYWLNPTWQDRNNYGLFTVEDLKLWIKNEGPIPKKEQPRGRRNR